MKNRITEIRLKKGITQSQLAEMADVSRTWLGLVERGQVDPSFHLLKKIARALDYEVKDLFFK